jgi:uncharacterized cupredoxin-like copper-binding protein
MRSTRRSFIAAVLITLGCAATPVRAHGDKHPQSPSAVVKEQKAWGIAGDARPGLRTIRVAMNDDMRFTPASITVEEGETVRIVVKNDGRLMHEFVLGTKEVHDEHAALMLKFPNMEHDEPYMVHVPPGQAGEILWTFNRAGEFGFACLIAGHYQAGMVGQVNVRPKAATGL